MRSVLVVASVVLLVVWLVPPLSPLARRYEYVEALQFVFFAVVVPALMVTGAPWVGLHLASARPPSGDDVAVESGEGPGPVDRLSDGRRRHPEVVRSAAYAGVALAGAVVWRTPAAVDALARRPWLSVLEAAVLLIVGTGLWLELVESPPLVPRLPRPYRTALAAVSMWVVWIMAYLVGLSHGSWYSAYPHHAGIGVSLSADQQLATGVMWFVSACAFVPVIFANLIRWLQAEEDPDEELRVLVRQERTRGRTLGPGPSTP